MSDIAPSSRARKIRAALAGGLVLGVGAAITLAAWNDSEFATGTFEAGDFNLEGSLNGTEFIEHDTVDTAAPLAFGVDASNLAPGDIVSAPFAVRLDATTSYDAGVVVRPAGTTNEIAGLTYTLTTTVGFGCDATVGDTLVAAGTALDAVGDTAAFNLVSGVDSAAGAAVNLCFTVTANDDLDQGQSGTATWEFLATSDSPEV
ncbi:SipW-dependent-type signal peptide-containing protein [Brachybacterium massiliense]|uniref:SipW-dependent-type signal peptide-containing protein n=1 Tax=Brachybacterium massiliense TaxID=1755098 RepID=UPI000B3BB3AA|nr:SipW-dependent-type signal peptide-containing protein [Brachybacterium massiliense]